MYLWFMYVTELATNQKHSVKVEPVTENDYKQLTKKHYYFNWKTEKGNEVYKLVLDETILGLMSCVQCDDKRIEIRLLAVSKENRGKNKKFDGITGTLIAYACREAIKQFGIEGCVSLVPKTALKQYYLNSYGMSDAGWQVFLDGEKLLETIQKYEL